MLKQTAPDPSENDPDQSTPSQRRTNIIDAVFAHRGVRIEQIAEKLGVSTATVYRDVQALEDEGIVERSKGFLRALTPSTADLPPNIRKKRQLTEKTRLAEAAVWGEATYNPNDYVINMKQQMLRASDERNLLVDHSKFSRAAWQKTTPLATFTKIIATKEASDSDIARLKEQCSNVQVV